MDSIVLSAAFASASSHKSSHLHDSHQLLYVTRGQAQITVSEKTYCAKPGTLILISRFETHCVEASSPDYCRYTLQISPRVSTYGSMIGYPVLSVLTNRPANFRHSLDMSACPEMETLLCKMVQEKEKNAPMGEKMLDLHFLQLLLYLSRTHPNLVTQEDPALHLVQQVQSFLETNYAAPCSLEDLALRFHLSASHLSHQFKRIAGISVMGYLQACRLAAAKEQLARTDLPVGRIVENCGYSDNSNFSRYFQSVTGLTPTQFRKSHR